MRRLAGFAAALAALGSIAAVAQASTVPAAITATSCQSNASGIFERIDQPGDCALGRALASLILFPFVNLSVQATSVGLLSSGVFDNEGATADARYFFQVTGGNPGDQVPLLVATNLSTGASQTSNSRAQASLLTHTNSFGDSLVVVCTDATCLTTATSFAGTLSIRARSGEIGELDLAVQAIAGPGLLPGFGAASADPVILVDPSFPGASLYSVTVSPGVGNQIASVPEPESAGLVALSAGLSIWIALHRRAKDTPFGEKTRSA
jgi:hypothetical protein